MKTIKRAIPVALVTMVAVTSTAFAAATTSTGGTSAVTSSSAKLGGAVDPNGQPTSYYFEYGPTQRYGSRTGDQAAGNGDKTVKASADVGGLQPNTQYHYRL